MNNNSKNKLYKLFASPLGTILLALSIIISRYFPENKVLDFISGFFVGLSIVFNLYYIINISKKEKNE
jgi:hypothetical protein